MVLFDAIMYVLRTIVLNFLLQNIKDILAIKQLYEEEIQLVKNEYKLYVTTIVILEKEWLKLVYRNKVEISTVIPSGIQIGHRNQSQELGGSLWRSENLHIVNIIFNLDMIIILWYIIYIPNIYIYD